MLLFDNNLPVSLCKALSEQFPGSVHVLAIGLDAITDHALWDYARERGLVIVTRDGDFEHLSGLRGAPPKVILLSIGNQSAKGFADLLQRTSPRMLSFIANQYDEVLIIRGEATFTVSSNDPSRSPRPD